MTIVAHEDPERKSRVEPVPEEELDRAARRALEEYSTIRTGHNGQRFFPGDEERGDNDDDS